MTLSVQNDSEEEEKQMELISQSATRLARLEEIMTESVRHLPILPIKPAESELDISKLHLNLNTHDSLEETASSDRLKEVLSDIERDLEDKSTSSMSPGSPEGSNQPNENLILTLNESVSLISRDLVNDEIQSSFVDEIDTKYIIHDDEETQISKDILEMRRQLVSSSSWPLIWNRNDYNLNQENNKSADEEKEMPQAVTSDRIEEVESKYVGQMKTKLLVTSATLTEDSDFGGKFFNEDKSYQVNPMDLPGAMVDTQTQMTPPLSPTKLEFSKSINFSVDKKSVGTETEDSIDDEFSDRLILKEEKQLRKKLIERENSLRSISIATQTSELPEQQTFDFTWNKVEEEVCDCDFLNDPSLNLKKINFFLIKKNYLVQISNLMT